MSSRSCPDCRSTEQLLREAMAELDGVRGRRDELEKDNRFIHDEAHKILDEEMAEDDADDGPICSQCGEMYSCDDGCEPDGFCHPCAHVAASKWKATDYALTVEHEKSTRYGAALRRIRYARDLKRARATASEALAKPKNMTSGRHDASGTKGEP